MTFGNTNQIMAGAEVYGSDNDKIGTIADVGQSYFLVQKGFLFIKDLYLPTRTIARVDADRVYLNVTKREAEDMATEELPSEGDAWYGTDMSDAANRSAAGTTGANPRATDTSYTTDTASTTNRTGAMAATGGAMAAGAMSGSTGRGGQIREEMDVIDSSGDRLGDVDEVGANYFKVGQFFGEDMYFPMTSVSRVHDNHVHLYSTADQARTIGRRQLPAQNDAWYTTSYDTTTTGRGMDTDRNRTNMTDRTMDTDRRAMGDRDNMTVPVVEEQLRAGVREVEGGTARVVKDVTQEQQSIDVPVQREEVYVTMRDVNRPATQADLDMRDREIDVPLREQEVVTSKQAVVTGEVEIRKEVVTDTERVTDTVRREEAHVEDTSNPRIHVEGDQMGRGRAASGGSMSSFSTDQRARYDAMSPNIQSRYGSLTEQQRRDYDTRYPMRRDNNGNILDPDGDGENAFEELGKNIQQGTDRPGNRNR